ncbi:hypothetical protein ABW20_dc0101802 [Dactylellina cionopaga]|nr:hypothetical protein ABW20_dc0101802 [Dactylellina cionopaga]
MHSYGAKIVFGDINETEATVLKNTLRRYDSFGPVDFVKTDVTSYDDVLVLFKKAYDLYGKVDVAVNLAGILDEPGWFDPTLNLETIQQVPSAKSLDVSLLGTLYFARIACVYLSQDLPKPFSPSQSNPDKNLILISSVLGFKALPGAYLYQAAKHGVLGLLRGLRQQLPNTHGIRVNAICPSQTRTQMVERIMEAWEKSGSVVNEPEDVANVILGVVVDKEKINGEAIYVSGGKAWGIEKGLQETQPVWMGEEGSADIENALATLIASFASRSESNGENK